MPAMFVEEIPNQTLNALHLLQRFNPLKLIHPSLQIPTTQVAAYS